MNDTGEQYDHILKVILVGVAAVGKTSICRRIQGMKWRPQYQTTVGLNLFNYILKNKQTTIEARIFDTGGQELFQSLDKFFYRGANGAIIVYDIAEKESWDSIDQWFDKIRTMRKIIPVLVLGNKTDLTRDRVVDRAVAQRYISDVIAPKWHVDNFNIPVSFDETSAKESGDEIIQLFERFVKTIYRNISK